MSLGSELLADYAFELEYPFGVAGEVWTTKDRRKIAVKDMTTQHIINCMRIVGKDDDLNVRLTATGMCATSVSSSMTMTRTSWTRY